MKNIVKLLVCGLAALCCACSEDDLTGEWSYSGPIPAFKDGPTEADKGCYALYQKYDVHVYWQLEGDAACYIRDRLVVPGLMQRLCPCRPRKRLQQKNS